MVLYMKKMVPIGLRLPGGVTIRIGFLKETMVNIHILQLM